MKRLVNLNDYERFYNNYLKKILRVRVPGTIGHREVKQVSLNLFYNFLCFSFSGILMWKDPVKSNANFSIVFFLVESFILLSVIELRIAHISIQALYKVVLNIHIF